MIDRTLACTPGSLESYLAAVSRIDETTTFDVPEEARHLVTRVETRSAIFLLHASDVETSPRVVFAYSHGLDLLRGGAVGMALQRAARVAVAARRPPVRLPPAWSAYHRGNLVAFFAGNRDVGALRWIAELHPFDTEDVFFCRITDSSEPVVLERFRPVLTEYRRVVQDWPDAFEQATKRFARRTKAGVTQIVATVDLDATSYGAVVGDRTYSRWIPALTSEQERFLQRPADVSTKLRGPAGTGKTLLLELKALHETYAAGATDKPPRILFVTHSWAMAEQVDAAIARLHDQAGEIDNISIFPLLSIAQDLIPSERQGRGFDLLGDDNLSGKALQLEAISRIVSDIVSRDWLAFEDRCSPAFAARASASRDSPEHRAFVWDLMQEFACVLSAHGILPGVNAARQYLPLQRMPWMMPLETDGEKLFVLEVYTRLVDEMRQRQLLTSDQLINDFLNYLETFAWNLRRGDIGYDLIFVDELHLFNEQERMALSFLSRDSASHPVMFMALDPRQSPAESYAGATVGVISATESGEADAALGRIEAVDLRTVHRFSPEILDLVRHINSAYPAVDLGEDWSLDVDRLETSVSATGRRPVLAVHDDRAGEVAAVFGEAMQDLAGRAADERVAIVIVDPLALERYAAAEAKGVALAVVRGRDEVDALRYSRRAIVLGPAEYLAGLQFHSVVVCGLPAASDRRANLGYERRRLLSLLYLAVSRATTSVSIHVNSSNGGVPDVLASAAERGIVEMGDGEQQGDRAATSGSSARAKRH